MGEVWLRRAAALAGIAVALLGPGLVARLSLGASGLGERTLMLLLFVGLLAAVLACARASGRASRSDLGFGRSSAWSFAWAVPLAAFFILVFGPAAYWALEVLRLPSFEAGIDALSDLPRWYLVTAIVIVAGGEEWLYRGYAIEALQRMTGSASAAAAISTLAFFLVHLPLWGIGPSLTTLVSGGILALLYLWRRDVLMLIAAHVATDLYGLGLNPSPAP